jgi:predicted nucleic acid-binding protein
LDSVIVDTNILLDLLVADRAHHETVTTLFAELHAHRVEVRLAATSLKDVYYITRKAAGAAAANAIIRALLDAMDVLAVDEACCRVAAASTEPDFEDGIIRACAEAAGADYLVSRDASAFRGSAVPRIGPAELLAELREPQR